MNIYDKPTGKCGRCEINDADEWWCNRCIIEKQLEHACERASKIPQLVKELQELGGVWIAPTYEAIEDL